MHHASPVIVTIVAASVASLFAFTLVDISV